MGSMWGWPRMKKNTQVSLFQNISLQRLPRPTPCSACGHSPAFKGMLPADQGPSYKFLLPGLSGCSSQPIFTWLSLFHPAGLRLDHISSEKLFSLDSPA